MKPRSFKTSKTFANELFPSLRVFQKARQSLPLETPPPGSGPPPTSEAPPAPDAADGAEGDCCTPSPMVLPPASGFGTSLASLVLLPSLVSFVFLSFFSADFSSFADFSSLISLILPGVYETPSKFFAGVPARAFCMNTFHISAGAMPPDIMPIEVLSSLPIQTPATRSGV